MDKLITENLASIKTLCKEHHVKELYLFGSASRKDFRESSDVDFLYVFDKQKIEKGQYADNYFDLLFNLQNLLGKKIDLVSLSNLNNQFFIQSIEKDKMKLYEA